ncbi:MAG: 50S ribosomal protein L6 [archaeon]
MKQPISQSIEIPEGIACSYTDLILTCKKDSTEVKREINIPQIELKIDNKNITLECKKANKNHRRTILTFLAHIKNMFVGLEKKFVYSLEAVNVHFPMAIKVEEDKVTINNFLGEKVPRYSKIMPNVNVEVKGQKITVSSPDREAAGQTAANLEKATKVKGRDRRIFQDGIFITEKPKRRSSLVDARKPATKREASQQEQAKSGGGEGH